MTDAKRVLRFLLVLAGVGAALTALAARLTLLHLGLDEHVRARIEKGRDYRVTLAASRGRILEGSASGNIVAMSVGVKDLWADPATITASGRVAEVSAALSTQLGQDIDALACLVNRTNREFAYIQRFVPDELAEKILGMKLLGVHANPSTVRQYQNGHFLCHVLGFANLDGIGSAGVEQFWDRYLRGSSGLVEGKRDARRREVTAKRLQDVQPEDGNDVVLTVDQNIQHIVEKALDGAMEKNHAQAAFAIVERIRTGEILAMASRPGYDPNAFRTVQNAQEVMLNRAIGYVYEPGSTFKVAIIAAALDQGLVQRDTVFDCENGGWLYRNKVLRDSHPYGNLTVADILKKSSNIGAAKITLLMGDERLYRSLRSFSIGQPLGIDLPGEEAGILHPVARWSGISASRIAIGQGVAVTGLQMLNVVCCLANDGVLMRPYVVRRVLRSDGFVQYERGPQEIGRPVSRETAALMRVLLTRVTEPEGTGTRAAVEGFRVAGKTGTAQKPIGGVYSETDYMASFVGFLPADKPEIGILVVVDTPQPLHTGGMVSAPVFSEIAEQTVRYLDIVPPSYAMAGP